MAIDDLDIDWDSLFERLERLLDLGDAFLSRQLAEPALDPGVFTEFNAFRWQRQGRSGRDGIRWVRHDGATRGCVFEPRLF